MYDLRFWMHQWSELTRKKIYPVLELNVNFLKKMANHNEKYRVTGI
eukprot:UN01133